jgi:L-ascorbate metabolism protein UlaG (beta-lactamase superfamily)
MTESTVLSLSVSTYPNGPDEIIFIGTATTVIRFGGFTLLTDPNFLHAGQHARLGYGLSSERLTDPALEIEDLPPIDLCVLSHYHGDHWDEVASQKLPKDLPIITTPQAAAAIEKEGFTNTYGLEYWESIYVKRGGSWLRITAMPGRHGPAVVDFALPDVMGSLIEWSRAGANTDDRYDQLARPDSEAVDATGAPLPSAEEAVVIPDLTPNLRMYISGDTLVYDELNEIPQRYPDIDIAMLHLGGTTVLGVMVTMDAEEGIKMVNLIRPRNIIPIHYNDYDVFKSPIEDFLRAAKEAGLDQHVHFLRHGERLALDIILQRS